MSAHGLPAGGRFVRRPARPGPRGALTLLLVGAFTVAATVVLVTGDGVRGGGWALLGEIALGALRPELSPGFLGTVAEASLRTVAYAVAGMTVAVALGLPGAVLASGLLVRRRATRIATVTATRGGLAFVRGIHELLWALLFVQAFGLSPLAGVLAIGIPYAGIVGRIVAERLADVDPAPLDALVASGASPWQVLVWGRLPLAAADIVSYLTYRFECAVRAAAVLSFVGLGGIGFRIELALDDLAFDQVWTLFAALALLVVAIDAGGARLRRRLLGGAGGARVDEASARRWGWSAGAGLLVTTVVAWWFVAAQGVGGPGPLSATAWDRAASFLADLAGADPGAELAFTSAAAWQRMARLAGETLAMSVLAAGLAAVGALLTLPFGARNLTTGEAAGYRRGVGRAVFVAARGFHLVTRAVPELLWAFVIVLVLPPGLLAAAIALAIHNLGVLGRLGSDVIEDLEPGPIIALRGAGASGLAVLAYGVIPQVVPQLITYLLYRWEVIIRATAVVGFVAAAGLGYQLRLDLSFFRLDEVGQLLVVYLLLVWSVDLASAGLRRLGR